MQSIRKMEVFGQISIEELDKGLFLQKSIKIFYQIFKFLNNKELNNV